LQLQILEFRALVPNPNVDPLIVPNPPGVDNATEQTVIIDNARAYNPTIIDSTGQNVTYLPLNANYTTDGTESYINSGWIWPEGQVPPGAPPITSFSDLSRTRNISIRMYGTPMDDGDC
jgi:hypothetical protein